MIALSLAEEADDPFHGVRELDVPLYVVRSVSHKAGYRFGATPQTVVIGDRGRILANWVGAYSTAIQRDIAAILNARVPVIPQ